MEKKKEESLNSEESVNDEAGPIGENQFLTPVGIRSDAISLSNPIGGIALPNSSNLLDKERIRGGNGEESGKNRGGKARVSFNMASSLAGSVERDTEETFAGTTLEDQVVSTACRDGNGVNNSGSCAGLPGRET